MRGLLRHFLEALVRRGSLDITTAAGERYTVGDGSGNPVAIEITDVVAERALLLNPELALGELFSDGRLIVRHGSVYDLLALVGENLRHGSVPGVARGNEYARKLLRIWHQWNSPFWSSKNVQHHYDLSGRLYDLFLDLDRQYSCAYFEHPGQTLDDAQLAKRRHIAAKLLLEPGHCVLDVGCGWGGLALYLAHSSDVDVCGITLSKEQLAIATERAARANLTSHVDFRLQDYRALEEQFDRIVSVGMFEHVGVGYYETYFRKVHELLIDDGVMLLHSIGRMDGPGATNPWIERYIFPGGYAPALSEVLPAIERAGLIVTDVEILRLHYAETLRHWRQRFMQRRREAAALYDERFCRMWEFYLAASEVAFRYSGLMVFQIQIAKRQEAVPLTRSYIAQREAELMSSDVGRSRKMVARAELAELDNPLASRPAERAH
jgi:cyclopropane-fatty-acyl-phospholipid synthase